MELECNPLLLSKPLCTWVSVNGFIQKCLHMIAQHKHMYINVIYIYIYICTLYDVHMPILCYSMEGYSREAMTINTTLWHISIIVDCCDYPALLSYILPCGVCLTLTHNIVNSGQLCYLYCLLVSLLKIECLMNCILWYSLQSQITSLLQE